MPIKPGIRIVEGTITRILKNDTDNGTGFVKVLKIHPKIMQRSFDEAKSMVINEYQKHLEENWMAELIKKYPIKINNAVLP